MSHPKIKVVMTQMRNEVIIEFLCFYNNSEQLVIVACQDRWNELSDMLKMKEPHYLPNLHASLYHNCLYVNSMIEVGFQWISLIFKYPLIIHPILDYREDNFVEKNKERKT
jgi:hypothetical protein